MLLHLLIIIPVIAIFAIASIHQTSSNNFSTKNIISLYPLALHLEETITISQLKKKNGLILKEQEQTIQIENKEANFNETEISSINLLKSSENKPYNKTKMMNISSINTLKVPQDLPSIISTEENSSNQGEINSIISTPQYTDTKDKNHNLEQLKNEDLSVTYYKKLAFIFSILNLIVSLIIYLLFDFSNNQFQFIQEHFNISVYDIYLGIDGISIYFVLLTTIITPIGLISN